MAKPAFFVKCLAVAQAAVMVAIFMATVAVEAAPAGSAAIPNTPSPSGYPAANATAPGGGAGGAVAGINKAFTDAIGGKPEDLPVNRFMTLMLAAREKKGLPAGSICLTEKMNNAAADYAKQMASRGVMEHELPGLPKPDVRIEKAVGKGKIKEGAAENIAENEGRAPVNSVLSSAQQWLNSAGHLKNILKPNMNRMGYGVAQGKCPKGKPGKCVYYCQVFAKLNEKEFPCIDTSKGLSQAQVDELKNSFKLVNGKVINGPFLEKVKKDLQFIGTPGSTGGRQQPIDNKPQPPPNNPPRNGGGGTGASNPPTQPPPAGNGPAQGGGDGRGPRRRRDTQQPPADPADPTGNRKKDKTAGQTPPCDDQDKPGAGGQRQPIQPTPPGAGGKPGEQGKPKLQPQDLEKMVGRILDELRQVQEAMKGMKSSLCKTSI